MAEEIIPQGEETEDSIDKIITDFNIEDTAKQFREQVAPQRIEPQPQQRTEVIPDPLTDSDAHKAYLSNLASGQAALSQQLERTLGTISQFEANSRKAALESDIQKAVATVNEIVGHPKTRLIEAALEVEAQTDPKFKAIWDNRAKNPAALDRALKVKAKQLAEDFSFKVDPDLVRSQRALKTSQQQSYTTAKKEPGDEWSGLDNDEFQKKWNQAISGGY